MSVIYMNNVFRGQDCWEVRRERRAIISLIERGGLACNESVLIIY